MIIYSAEFVTSATDYKKCPEPHIPEYAFIGRSNVGKSSLINMLTQKKGLAKTSGTPGKTQTINHFILNAGKPQPWYLVDLPGYGYAKVAKTSRKTWSKFIFDYLEFRENLICTFALVDARHEPQQSDVDFIVKLGKMQVPFVVVFTKTDKVKPLALKKNMEAMKSKLLEHYTHLPPIFSTSSENREGREELLNFIQKYCAVYNYKQVGNTFTT